MLVLPEMQISGDLTRRLRLVLDMGQEVFPRTLVKGRQRRRMGMEGRRFQLQ
jgi:hypothetical protein